MGLFSKSIALEPDGGGGNCLSPAALLPADIIVSTGGAAISTAIRLGTMSVVSHAALFAGGGDLIEAIGAGVTKQSLMTALEDDTLAVVYRHPAMDGASATAIVAYAGKQVGKPYSTAGVAMANDLILCSTVGSGTGSFFCSQLVIEAFKQGGKPLTPMPAGCVSPGHIAQMALRSLTYVGHLKGDPSYFPIVSG